MRRIHSMNFASNFPNDLGQEAIVKGVIECLHGAKLKVGNLTKLENPSAPTTILVKTCVIV